MTAPLLNHNDGRRAMVLARELENLARNDWQRLASTLLVLLVWALTRRGP